jgi:hypothetical protein
MSLKLDYTVPSTGAVAGYHRVPQVSIDKDASLTTATVTSYVSKDAYDAGKFALYTQSIQLPGVPTPTADPFTTVEARLIEATPTDGTASTLPGRYSFAGATLVD